MARILAIAVGLVGLLLVVVGVALWVTGDSTDLVVSIPLASTGVLWAPLLWLLGIIVLLSAALANTLPLKNYIVWLALLIVGYLAVFVVIASIGSLILP
ncbi:MAG: hypothetical protein ABSD99_09030 [Candidatus Bathyarchaeia archaeon]